MNTSPRSIAARALVAWRRSSPVRKRTTTLVSSARTPLRLRGDGGVHLLDRYRRAVVDQRAEHVLDVGLGEQGSGPQHHPLRRVLDREPGPRTPAPLLADRLGQDHLALRGDDGGGVFWHGTLSEVRRG